MALSLQTYLNGITAWIIVIIGFTYYVVFLVKYFQRKKPLLPYVSLAALCLGTFYLGPGITFLKLVFTGTNLDPTLYFMISYTLNPVGTLIVVYLGFSIFQPKYKNQASYFYLILLAVYWVFMFVWPENAFETIAGEEMLDTNLAGVIRIITAFNILTVLLVVSTGFIRLAIKMKKKGAPKGDVTQLFMIGFGWLLFVIGAITDAIIPASLFYFIIAGRIVMAIGYFMIFEGFMPPKQEKISKKQEDESE
ncbi:MAG: hypothetical protein K9W44_06085 [Candidatus Lokiarchaeota archaeon]|nr:hypothetical protein [Candidatus Harpocratesius repetitus]